jgi:hypothetical protein
MVILKLGAVTNVTKQFLSCDKLDCLCKQECVALSCLNARLEATRVEHFLSGAKALSTTTLSIMTLSIMTLSIMTLSIMTLNIMTLNTMTLSIMTLSITTLSIMTLSMTTFSKTTLSIIINKT